MMLPNDDNSYMQSVWLIVASLAGAITAQIWQPWKDMGPGKVALTIFAGTTFGYYVFPVFFAHVSDQKMAGGLTYLMASSWNLLLPVLLKRVFGTGDAGGGKP
jgi:hypothetical protein